jgi:hypothetical protein
MPVIIRNGYASYNSLDLSYFYMFDKEQEGNERYNYCICGRIGIAARNSFQQKIPTAFRSS